MKEKASFDENHIRDLRGQIDSPDWDLRRTLEGFLEASQAEDRLQQAVSDKERALHEDRLRGFREIEAIKRNHQIYVDAFFDYPKSQENQKYHQQSHEQSARITL